MGVSRDEVRRIAALARLRLDPDEEERLTEELGRILGHVAALSELEAKEVEGVGSMAGGAAPVRAPDDGPDDLRGDPEEWAPAWREGFFTVPRLEAMDGEPGGRAP